MEQQALALRPAYIGGYVVLLVRQALMLAAVVYALTLGDRLYVGGLTPVEGAGMLIYLVAHLILYVPAVCASILMRRQTRTMNALSGRLSRALAVNYFFIPALLVISIPFCYGTGGGAASAAGFFTFLFFDVWDAVLCVWCGAACARLRKAATFRPA